MGLKIEAWATVKKGNKLVDGVYEITENGRFMGYAPILRLKEMGYVKRVDHCSAAEGFINTAEGKAWFAKARTFTFA